MSVKYTDGAKTFIGAILIGAVALIALLAFILLKPEKKVASQLELLPKKELFTCCQRG